ncbi:MAG: hypothetical protein Q9207_006983 [Kuettlingeria erythrocarpa]
MPTPSSATGGPPARKKLRLDESQSSTIDLKDEHYHITLLLEFLYTHRYTTDTNGEAVWFEHAHSVPRAHLSLYVLGDKYDIPMLRCYAINRFRDHLAQGLTVIKTLYCVPFVYFDVPETGGSLRSLVVQKLLGRTVEIAKEPLTKKLMLGHIHAIEKFREDIFQGLLEKSHEPDGVYVRNIRDPALPEAFEEAPVATVVASQGIHGIPKGII